MQLTQHDIKQFYDGLKAVYGPCDSDSAPVRSKDGSTLIVRRFSNAGLSILNPC